MIKKVYDKSMDKKERTIKSEIVYEGKILNLKRDEVLCPNGEKSIREIISHHGGWYLS